MSRAPERGERRLRRGGLQATGALTALIDDDA